MAYPRHPTIASSSRDRHERANAPSASFRLAPPTTICLPGLPAQAPLPTIPHRAQSRRRDDSARSPRPSDTWPSFSRRAPTRGTFSTGSSTGATTGSGSSYQGSNSGGGGGGGSNGNNDKKKETGSGGGSSSTPSGPGSRSSSGLTVENVSRTSGYYEGIRSERDAAGEGEGAETQRRAWVRATLDYEGRRVNGDGA